MYDKSTSHAVRVKAIIAVNDHDIICTIGINELLCKVFLMTLLCGISIKDVDHPP